MTTASGVAFLNGDQTWRSSNYRRHEATHILYHEVCVHTFSERALTPVFIAASTKQFYFQPDLQLSQFATSQGQLPLVCSGCAVKSCFFLLRSYESFTVI